MARARRAGPLDRLSDELVQAGFAAGCPCAPSLARRRHRLPARAGAGAGDGAACCRSRRASRRWPPTSRSVSCAARARRRRARLRDLWPEAVDNLASAVRAGHGAARGAVPARHPRPGRAARAVRGVRRRLPAHRAVPRLASTGSRSGSSDPVGDRVVESLRIAREVGGTDLGRLLRTLSGFLREDARTRGRAGDPPGLDRQRRPARGGRAVGRAGHARRRTPSPWRPTPPRPASWCWPSGAP